MPMSNDYDAYMRTSIRGYVGSSPLRQHTDFFVEAHELNGAGGSQQQQLKFLFACANK